MFERFTNRARKVVVLAQEQARLFEHNYIGTEHILLGLMSEGEGVGCKAMESLGVSLEALRREVEEVMGRGKEAHSGHIPFTPQAKRVLELSLKESLQLGHNYIGTEHILLGLISEGDGIAAQVLVRHGADLDAARRQVVTVLQGYQAAVAFTQPVRALDPRRWLGRFERRLAAIEDRLAAVEEHLGIAQPTTASAALGAERGRAEAHGDTAQAVGADDEPGEGPPGYGRPGDEPGERRPGNGPPSNKPGESAEVAQRD